MFRINISLKYLEEYYNVIKDGIVDNLQRQIQEIEESGEAQLLNILKWLNEIEEDVHVHIKNIIVGSPQELMIIYMTIYEKYIQKNDEECDNWTKKGCVESESKLRKVFEKIFDYDSFSKNKKFSYDTIEKTGVKICPYCNRQYIFTIKNEEDSKYLIRPEFDHFFPKSRFPMFALSYQNLIPSCHICNSNLKGAKYLSLSDYHHPYSEDKRYLKFEYELVNTNNSVIRLNYNGDRKAENTGKLFRTEEIYVQHTEETDKLLRLYKKYSPEYVEDLLKQMQARGIVVLKEQLLNTIYGHFLVDDPDKELLGHLKKDLYESILKQYY